MSVQKLVEITSCIFEAYVLELGKDNDPMPGLVPGPGRKGMTVADPLNRIAAGKIIREIPFPGGVTHHYLERNAAAR